MIQGADWPPKVMESVEYTDNGNQLPVQLIQVMSQFNQSEVFSTYDSRVNTGSSFMPGGRRPRNPNLAKKKAVGNGLKRDTSTTEEKSTRRDKMRKYMKQGDKHNTGYQTMLELNGGETLGERDRKNIDEYIGIDGGDSAGQEKTKGGGIKQLQDEQRDIEAKLKFIDGLINQQQTTSVKYLGGGILKRQPNEDFVASLDQYQRAMEDLKKTMDNLRTKSNERRLKSRSNERSKQLSMDQTQVNLYQIYQHFDNTSQERTRQALSVIPTAEEKAIPNTSMDDYDETLSVSSPSTNNHIYESTLHMRQSYGSNRFLLKDSFKSSSLIMPNKLDNGQDAHVPVRMSITGSRSQTAKLSPDYYERGLEESPSFQLDRSNNSKALKVITEIVVQGGNHNSNDDLPLDDIKDGIQQHHEQFLTGMSRVDLKFEQPEKEIHHKPIYESKAYRPRTQVTNPNFQSTGTIGRIQKGELANEKEIKYDEVVKVTSSLGELPITLGKKLTAKKTSQTTHKGNEDLKTVTYKSAKTDTSKRSINFDDARVADMNKRVAQLPHAKIEELDQSVIFQQDQENSRGVLYFKNIDSLKNFLIKKKRPIYSRQGNKVYDNTNPLKPSQAENSDKNKTLAEQVQKKRDYLHQTLTTLMPQIQLKSLQAKTQKYTFEKTMDIVSQKYMQQTSPQKETTWVPISSQPQNLFNQNHKYPFDDIMNAEGIIDLKLMGNAPGATFFNTGSRAISRQEIQQQLRSESSPGKPRNARKLNRRLQTFYGLNIDKPKGNQTQKQTRLLQQDSVGRQRRGLAQNDSDKSLNSESIDSLDGRNNRQVVFFKTSNSNLNRQDTGSYVVQYPQLRPRLNMMQDDCKFAKTGTHTVGTHQKYNKQADNFNSNPVVSQGRMQYEDSLLRMSKEIEKNKFKDSSRNETTVFSAVQTNTRNSLVDIQTSNKVPPRKHVIFSTFEGSVVKPTLLKDSLRNSQASIKTSNDVKHENKTGSKIPPLHPFGFAQQYYLQNQSVKQLKTQKQEGSNNFKDSIQQSQTSQKIRSFINNRSLNPSFKEMGSPPMTPAVQPAYEFGEAKLSLGSEDVSRKMQQNPSLKGLIHYDAGNKKKDEKSAAKMDMNISQSKIAAKK